MAVINGNEIFFGMTLTLGGEGSIIGAPVLSEDPPSSLTVTTFDIETLSTAALDFFAAIDPLWEWDDYDVSSSSAHIDFGQLRFYKGSSYNYRIYFRRMDSGGDYGSFELAVGTVTAIKGDDVLMITAPTADGYKYTIAVGYMTDDTGTKHKCIFTAPRYSTSSTRVLGGVDIGTEVVGFRGSTYYNDGWYRYTNRSDEMAPLFLDSATATYVADKILLARACVDRMKTGFYTVGDSKVYYGYTLGLKDGG